MGMVLALAEIKKALQGDEESLARDPQRLESLLEDIHFYISHIQSKDERKGLQGIDAHLTSLRAFLRVVDTETAATDKVVQFIKHAIGTSLGIVNTLSRQVFTMESQDFYIDRMNAAGYTLREGGHCYGLSNMAMQAFLAGDMKTFDARLELIDFIPVGMCSDDFRLAKKRFDRNEISNILAFFDGIVLYQSLDKYSHFFENPSEIQAQDAEVTRTLTIPVELDSEKKSQRSLILILAHTMQMSWQPT